MENKYQLIFIACVDLADKYSGISRKVMTEYKILNQRIPSMLVCYYKDGIVTVCGDEKTVIQNAGKHRRVMVIEHGLGSVNPDVKYVYIRRMPCNPLVFKLLSGLKREGVQKILWEIPTYPYDHENERKKETLKSRLVICSDRFYRKRLKKYVDRIVTFSDSKNIFGIPCINTGNGIDVESIRPRRTGANAADEIHMIAVAVLHKWHGYDRLINGLAEYYQNAGKRKIRFHLVGDGECLQEYKELVKKHHLDDHVIFYGFKMKDEIDDIYDQCNIAVESLGWHRSQVPMGTSIKTREYLAKGLPIIASSPMDIFPDGWEYAYYAPIDDSPVDIDGVIDFFDRIHESLSDEDMAKAFREICRGKCDMSFTMKPIIRYLLEEES